jgi:putative transposase
MDAVTELATEVGTRAVCHALFVPRGSYYRNRRSISSHVPTAPRPRSVRALAPVERETILDYLHQERFQDRSPAAVYATLLDEPARSFAGRLVEVPA